MTDEQVRALQHQLIFALSEIAAGMRQLADDVQSGKIPPRHVASVLHIVAGEMTASVRELSA